MCKEGRKSEITAVWPQFHSPRAWLSSMFMGFQLLEPARNSRTSFIISWSSLGAASACAGCSWKVQRNQGWDTKHFTEGQGIGTRLGQEGSNGRAGLGKSIPRRAVLSSECGGKANPTRKPAASTGLQSLHWLFVLCCDSFLFLVWIKMRARRRPCLHSSAMTVSRASREEQRPLDFCLCCLYKDFAL